MPVCKIIFRLDFRRPNFDILDKPGTVLRLMSELGENFWSDFEDVSQKRMLRAVFRNRSRRVQFRQLTVELTTLNFVIEDAQGIEFANLESNEFYSTIFKGIQALHEKFKLNELNRAGLRFFYLGSIGDNMPDLRPAFRKLIDETLVEIVRSSVGKPDDYGINLDGADDDKVKYHLRFGPYKQNEARRYFDEVYEQIVEQGNRNLICDLDLFEEKFALTGTKHPINWTRPLVSKAQNLIKGIEELISKQL